MALLIFSASFWYNKIPDFIILKARNSKFHDFLIFGPTINSLLGLFMACLWLIYGLLMVDLWPIYGLNGFTDLFMAY